MFEAQAEFLSCRLSSLRRKEPAQAGKTLGALFLLTLFGQAKRVWRLPGATGKKTNFVFKPC